MANFFSWLQKNDPAKAAIPAEIWTTVPPTKSKTPILKVLVNVFFVKNNYGIQKTNQGNPWLVF